ncbi:MAG: thiamine phosphate synthase [Candidatus Anstonellales archaeon]
MTSTIKNHYCNNVLQNKKKRKIGCYLILNDEISKLSLTEQVKIIVDNGIELPFIQYRVRNKNFFQMSKEVNSIINILDINKVSTKLIVNDFLELGIDYAHGIHLGERDASIETAVDLAEKKFRRINVSSTSNESNKSNHVDSFFLIGLTANSIRKVREINKSEYVDLIEYIGLGPVSFTQHMPFIKPLGIINAKKALSISKLPIVFIGGLKAINESSLFSEPVPEGLALMSTIIKYTHIDTEKLRRFMRLYESTFA